MTSFLIALLLITPAQELTQLAERFWRQREESISALKSPEEIRARRKLAQATMLRLIGGLPDQRTQLNSAVTAKFDRQDYSVENVVFESLPGFRVTANLYLPKGGRPPYPAILGVAGHSTNGKASATYQHAWIGFVKRGYAVLAYDPPGQGERLEYPAEDGGSRVGIGVNEHLEAGLQCLLAGTSIARYFVWDGVRAFDYLASRPEIDVKRIAVAGNSGGGTQAAYLAAFEPRLAAAISSCYMTRWRELWSGPGPQDAEQIWPGFISEGLDFDDFALAFSPRPYLMTTAIRDYFPIAGARATFRVMTEIFERLNVPQNAGYFEYDDPHGWSKPRRQAAARWLDKHFKGVESDGAEPAIETEPEGRLLVFPQGIAGGRTVRELNLARAEAMYAVRRASKISDAGELRAFVWRRLGIPSQLPALRREETSSEQLRSGLMVKRGRFWAEGRRDVPFRSYAATGLSGARPAILSIGMGGDAEALARTGLVVVAIDPSGFGDEAAREGPGYSQAYQLAARAWLTGRNLPGMAVEDALSVLRWMRGWTEIDGARIGVMGKGSSGVVALLAAALDPGVKSVATERMPVSYLGYCRATLHKDLASLVIPGVLEDFDLPDANSLLQGRETLLVDPVNGAGRRMTASMVSEYPGAKVGERAEGWPVEKVYAEWLSPYSSR